MDAIMRLFRKNRKEKDADESPSERDELKLTARERELAQKRNGNDDFMLTPGLDNAPLLPPR